MADRAISPRLAVRAWRCTWRRAGVVLGCALPLLGWTTVSPAAVSPEIEALIESVDDQTMAIEQLTVAPAGAWVVRSLTVESLTQLEQSDSSRLRRAAPEAGGRLWIGGLPATLDGDSLRVAGAMVDGEAGVRLEREVIRETPAYQRLSNRLTEVQAEARALAVALEENTLRRRIARDQLAALSPTGEDLASLWRDNGPVDELMSRLTDERRALLDRQTSMDEDIDALRAALDELAGQAPGWRVGVALNQADLEPGAEALRLEYRVENAGWEPIYRARLDTTERQVDWRMTARVHQQTGEDWPAVPMTLVTSDQRRFYPVPEFSPLTIGFIDPDKGAPVRPMAQSTLMRADAAGLAEAGRVEDQTGFATRIAVNKPAAIPSGEGGVNLVVLEQPLDAEISLRIAPQSDRDAVVVGRFVPSIVNPLPAGRWEIHRDGQQQAGLSRPALQPDEPVELSFGVDPRLVVDYQAPPDERAGHGLIGKFHQIERRRQVTVTSRHQTDVPVVVLMRMPTPLDADIVVEALAETDTPAERQFDGQKGVWAYERKMAPDESWQIDFGYRVRWPEGKQISPF
ncbi:mucoidy inhibitor MuiA family protein [Guyparkeria halophila]|uniref:Mucoidy inhibitor MuiA family protein n=1 Tax=Guyparkeria halophila TaxID=47960 RepID=A0ABZ0YUA1_9GAMM|nr:mucoidy inhibitor MuiA family protein [Guyparkeria halophila]WQH15747.1 mucoidy inhibitor MuiA family protein [Guyparkeria halophila]